MLSTIVKHMTRWPSSTTDDDIHSLDRTTVPHWPHTRAPRSVRGDGAPGSQSLVEKRLRRSWRSIASCTSSSTRAG
jgi:hypothetical protein